MVLPGFVTQVIHSCGQFGIEVTPEEDGCTFGELGEMKQIFPDVEVEI